MKEASYAEVEDWIGRLLFAMKKIVIFGPHWIDHCQKRNLTDEDLKQFENYQGNPSESTPFCLIFTERKI